MAAANAATEPASDEELVVRLRQGDRAAFDVLYERYLPRVYRFVERRVGNRADAEETVQEVFVNTFSSLESYRGEAPFAAWLFGLARRTVASRYKKKRRDVVPLGEEDGEGGLNPTSAEPDPLEAYEYHERLRRLQRAMRSDLSDEQRRLFKLHHLQNRSIQEIALQVDKSEDAVKSHLYRARKLLLAR